MHKLLESQTVEFKQIWKDEYLKTICAFANSEGGILYIGLNDDAVILGVENIEELIELLPNKINNRLGLVVDIILKNSNNKNYLEVKVNKTYAPISYNGKFYIRSGSNHIELNGVNLTNFLLKKYGKTWDDVIEERFTLDEIDLNTIERFKKLAKDRVPDIVNEDNIEELLRKLNLYEGNYLKREAIINALIDRDYTNTSNLQIRVYDDKLVLYNGATLNPEVPIEKFDKPHQSKPFNPTMASVFYKCGFIENWGKGTINIINECLEYGLPKPTFEYGWEALRTTFYKRVENEIIDGGINVGVNVGVNEIHEYIKQNQPIRAKAISNHFPQITQRTIERYIKQLKDENKIEFRGIPKTGGYC